MLNALSTLLVGELLLPGFLIWKGGPSPELEGFKQKPAVVARHVVRARGHRAMTAFDQLATDWLMQQLSNTLATKRNPDMTSDLAPAWAVLQQQPL